MVSKMSGRIFTQGMTVKELKDLISQWPETDGNGEPTEVFIESDQGCSSPVFVASPLNASGEYADILLKYRLKRNG